MTELKNEITVAAPRSGVWQALTNLGALAAYDPGVKKVSLVGELTSGLGAQRKCEAPRCFVWISGSGSLPAMR